VSLLLETIKVEDTQAQNLSYHQKRFDKSRKALFGCEADIDLSALIKAPSSDLYRCRISYDSQIRSIEYLPYKAKEIHSIKIVSASFDYRFKYANREAFTTLLQRFPQADDILIEKEGLLTDTSIANIAFYDGEKWCTPHRPLLEGTMRAKLLDEGFLHSMPIYKERLSDYTHVALMNAMIGFKILKNPTLN